MVYVKLVRQKEEKEITEMLNLSSGNRTGVGIDRIILSDSWGTDAYGFRITQEDLESLFQKKKRECAEYWEKRKTEKEKEIDEQLNELKEIKRKQEERDRKFLWHVFKWFMK